MFRSLLNLLFDRPDKKAPYSSKRRRWHFADGNVPGELELKEQTLAKIERLWSQLNIDGNELMAQLEQGQSENLVKWVCQYVQVIDKRVMWEVGPAANDENIHKLSLSAEAHDELKPIIDTIVNDAPKIEGWVLENGREPLPAKTIESALSERLGVHGIVGSVPPFAVSFAQNDVHRIDLVIESHTFKTENDGGDFITALMLCDMVLGERNVDRFLGVVETKPGPAPADFSCESAAGLFANNFAKAKEQLKSCNPSTPWLELFTGNESIISQLFDTDSLRQTLTTKHPELFSAMCKSKFYSEQFSNRQEKFCYLQCEDINLDTDRLSRLQDRVDSVLRGKKIGCSVGYGAGTNSIFIDLCLNDVTQAILVLRNVCVEEGLPHSCVLRFYDADWCHEWVGMFADTPEPKSSEYWT